MLIKKGDSVLNVTKGAFTALFANMGYQPATTDEEVQRKGRGTSFMLKQTVSETPKKNEANETPFGWMFDSDEYSQNQYEESLDYEGQDFKVVTDEMTVKELISYSNERGIDLRGAAKKSDIIRIINAAMEVE